MNFKEWLTLNEERFKGLKRQFSANNPSMPRYVGNQIYNNQVMPQFKKFMKDNAPTIMNASDDTEDDASKVGSGKVSAYGSPNTTPHHGVVWSKTPTIIQITPLDFDSNTLSKFINWKFGFSPKDHKVRNDTERFSIQKNLMVTRQDKNEPVVLIRELGKYHLIDGFHRTMI